MVGSIGSPDPPAPLPSDGVAAGYRTLLEGAALVDREDRVVGRMWGRDPAKMLNGLITNDLSKPDPTRAVYGAMLTPKGRMITDLRAIDVTSAGGSELLFDVPSVVGDQVAAHLKKFVPPLFARWELPAAWTVTGVYGPEAARTITAVFGQEPEPGEDTVLPITLGGVTGVAVATAITGSVGYDLLFPSGSAAQVRAALLEAGAVPVEFEALEMVRVEAGRPRYGLEMTEETMPAEVYSWKGAMERAVSFSKGCYTGQEVVVRLAHRGHVNRNLRGLLLGTAEAPPHRTAIYRPEDGKEIGWVTSAVASPRHGQTIALGFVRREIDPGAEVRVGSTEGPRATVAELPFQSAH